MILSFIFYIENDFCGGRARGPRQIGLEMCAMSCAGRGLATEFYDPRLFFAATTKRFAWDFEAKAGVDIQAGVHVYVSISFCFCFSFFVFLFSFCHVPLRGSWLSACASSGALRFVLSCEEKVTDPSAKRPCRGCVFWQYGRPSS